MIKKIFCALLITSMCLLLTSCKMSDYDKATVAMQDRQYDEAIALFAKLGDYRDSQVQLKKAIDLQADRHLMWNDYEKVMALYQQYSHVADFSSQQQEVIEKYVSELLSDADYETAISVYQKYSSIADYSSRIAELKSEKKLYDIYYDAMRQLERGEISKGFALLETLPKGFRNIDQIYSSYYALKDSRFTGSHRMNNPKWTNSQKVEFSLMFRLKDECFCIRAYLTVYWSDGTVYSRENYYGYADDLKDNTLRTGKYKWVMNENGKIVDW